MSFFDDLKGKINSVRQDMANKKDFRQQLMDICSDGKITDTELERINQLAQQYNIEQKDFNKVKIDAFQMAFKAVMSDGVLTRAEMDNILEVQQVLQVFDHEIPKEYAVLKLHQELREIQDGRLPTIHIGGLILKDNEIAHFAIQANLVEEKVVSRTYQGGSAGVSFRVAKGVTFRVGNQRGKMVSQTGLVDVDSGYFIMTNKRFMFKGSKKSFAYTFKQLVGYTVYNDGMHLHSSRGATRLLRFMQDFQPDIVDLIANKLTMA